MGVRVGENSETTNMYLESLSAHERRHIGHFTSWDEVEDAVLSQCRRQIVELYPVWIRI